MRSRPRRNTIRAHSTPFAICGPRHAADHSNDVHKMPTPMLLLSLLLAPLLTLSSPPLEVRTTSGTFNGLAVEGGLDRWLGIPFAQPPVGSLRFKAPVPITKAASGVKNASTFGNACPQVPSDSINAPISEDCLFLNVSLPFRRVRSFF